MLHITLLAVCLLLCQSFNVVRRYPHEIDCYTQGLEFVNSSVLVQSCGQYNQSRIELLSLNPQTKQLTKIKEAKLESELFGEGTTVFNDKIYQLTWLQRRVIIYNMDLRVVRTLRWERDGWGLAHNQTHLFTSDGSSIIYVVDKDFQLMQKINVQENGQPVRNLNELEYYKGYLLANIYFSTKIVVINITTGEVVKKVEAEQLNQEQSHSQTHHLQGGEVLNGIAFDSKTNRMLLTGKNWFQVYEIPAQQFDVVTS